MPVCWYATLICAMFMTGVGGYSYLYEPLWWVGMITSDPSSLLSLLPFCLFSVSLYSSLSYCPYL